MATPPLILSIDTSGPFVAAGLSDRPDLARVEEMARGQAERLGVLCEDILKAAGHVWADLDAVAVGVGPGNFTGIRIAVSFARGIALGLGIPSVGVNAFEVFHQGRMPGSGRVLVSLPAPQNRAYVQVFLHGTAMGAPMMITPGEVLEGMEQPGLSVWGHLAGDIAAPMNAPVVDMPDVAHAPLPVRIAHIAANKLADDPTPPRAKPMYVKPPDAAPSREAPPVILA